VLHAATMPKRSADRDYFVVSPTAPRDSFAQPHHLRPASR